MRLDLFGKEKYMYEENEERTSGAGLADVAKLFSACVLVVGKLATSQAPRSCDKPGIEKRGFFAGWRQCHGQAGDKPHIHATYVCLVWLDAGRY